MDGSYRSVDYCLGCAAYYRFQDGLLAMPPNPYEPPKEVEKPAKNDWLAIVALLVIVGVVFYLALPTIQRINRAIDPPPPRQPKL